MRRGLETIKRCTRVFLEAYTSILLVGVQELEALYGVKVETADRELVESNSEEILKDALHKDVAFCVVGDPFGATTHSDLLLRARQSGIDVAVIHNASIMNAIAACGLQLYRFGQVGPFICLICLYFSPSQPDAESSDHVEPVRTDACLQEAYSHIMFLTLTGCFMVACCVAACGENRSCLGATTANNRLVPSCSRCHR
jgi:hypothetical protein